MSSDGSRPLKNARQEKFCRLVAEGRSFAEAYELAGYKPSYNNAQRLRGKEGVSERIAYLLSRAAAKTELTAEYVIKGLMDNYRRATGELATKAGVTNRDGSPIINDCGVEQCVSKYTTDLAAANKALELLGKKLALFVDVKTKRPYEDLDDETLKQRVMEALKK
jgi:hypothetical protein